MTIQTIYFEFETREETPRISAPEEFSELLGAATTMDERDEITVMIDYPLDKPYKMTIRRKPITVESFARAVADAYKAIYCEEARTSQIPEDRLSAMSLNRNKTNGKYGIWGHGMGDLYLEGAVRQDDGTWRLLIGS